MAVDVLTEIVIERPRDAVASCAANPDNAPAWYVNIKSVEWHTQPAVAVGSKVAFVAQFLAAAWPTRTRSSSSHLVSDW